MRRRRRYLSRYLRAFYPLAVLAALTVLFLNKMAFTNLVLARGDTFLYFYPYWQAAADALRAGRVPLWNPNLFMGVPFLANSQVGFFYPLNWPLWLMLSPPYAVSATILLHIFLAGVGTYLAARRTLSQSKSAALISATLYALGGYLTAQAEHVNQLQGLAWLPWLFWVVGDWPKSTSEKYHARVSWRQPIRISVAVAGLLSLQLLSGHTQTVWISVVGLATWLLLRGIDSKFQTGTGLEGLKRRAFSLISSAGRAIAPLVFGGLLAALLSGAQLLPTLELSSYSSRQGGLPINEALSFSLHPLLLSRALLPSYGQTLFTEYVAFLPLSGLLLSIAGAWLWNSNRRARLLLILVFISILLALGGFNPLYRLLALLPPFSLFRAPARWLSLYALSMAFLAGEGWQAVDVPPRLGHAKSFLGRRYFLGPGLVLLLLLMLWAVLAVPLASVLPIGPEAPAELPLTRTWLGWLAELILFYLLLIPAPALAVPGVHYLRALLLAGFLFLGSRSLPYNMLTTPEAYFDLRPPISRLTVASPCKIETPACGAPTGRLLSLSDIFFDPGDIGEIEAIYADQLSDTALYDYTVAIKQKEIIAPNLPLAYGLSSVDGFDGGVLPLRSFSDISRLILPEGKETRDGRLREQLTAVPQAKWLDLFNARFLIADKVADVWRQIGGDDSVYFDLQFPTDLAPGEAVAVGYVPQFEATALVLVADGRPGTVQVETSSGERWQLATVDLGEGLMSVEFPPVAPNQALSGVLLKAVSLTASEGKGWLINGLTLVNEVEGTFQSLVLGNYRLIHSGDVKIYENLDVLPRAFFVSEWIHKSSMAEMLSAMAAEGFNPSQIAVVLDPSPGSYRSAGTGAATILSYRPEEVVISTDSAQGGLMVLADAYYPGWKASLDGQPVPIMQADGLFRGVLIPAGRHDVVFSFRPQIFAVGGIFSLLGSLAWLTLAGLTARKRRRSELDPR